MYPTDLIECGNGLEETNEKREKKVRKINLRKKKRKNRKKKEDEKDIWAEPSEEMRGRIPVAPSPPPLFLLVSGEGWPWVTPAAVAGQPQSERSVRPGKGGVE